MVRWNQTAIGVGPVPTNALLVSDQCRPMLSWKKQFFPANNMKGYSRETATTFRMSRYSPLQRLCKATFALLIHYTPSVIKLLFTLFIYCTHFVIKLLLFLIF
jgi:hypothetical protein